jgi:hypothetical protein
MSLPQQMRSDVAALEADQRRRDRDERSKTHVDPGSLDKRSRRRGIGGWLRAWTRALFSR